jgi:SRSO17 transposase
MEWDSRIWEKSIDEFRDFMMPLVAIMGRSERRVAATRYVGGLLLPGERKSIEPMAARLGVDGQSLQQFVTDSPWDEQTVWRAIRQEIIPHLEPIEAWVIDETGWVKQGKHSVGVAHQYCGAVGKNANCQVSVELTTSNGWVAAPIGGRLYLPKSWTSDPARCRAAGVPSEVVFQTKPELAVALTGEALADGVIPAPVLGDSVYGDSSELRSSLRNQGLEFFLQVTPTAHKGWAQEVPTVVKQRRRRLAAEVAPAQTLAELAQTISTRDWKDCKWTTADGKTRSTRLAWMQVYLGHNLRHADGELEKLWLVIDWPENSEAPYHYYLAHLHRLPTTARCLKLSRSRWHIEQYYQRSKTDLGLDHYEGRSWRGFHHHLVLCAIAYLFVLAVYSRHKKNFWAHVGTSAPRDPTVLAEIRRLLPLLRNEVQQSRQ